MNYPNTHRSATARSSQSYQGLRAVPADLIGIIGFGTEATGVLPLIEVLAPQALIAPSRLVANGNTNLTAGLALAHDWLRRLPRHILRKCTVIADGEPNIGTDQLVKTAALMRDDYISIDSVYCGTGEAGASVLRLLSSWTVGGHSYTAQTLEALTKLVTSSAARPHSRQAATVILVDTSTSMGNSLSGCGGLSRMAAAISACQSVVLMKRTAFGQVGRVGQVGGY